MKCYCVYFNETREQFHIMKTDRAIRYVGKFLRAGLTYEEADQLRQELNRQLVQDFIEGMEGAI